MSSEGPLAKGSLDAVASADTRRSVKIEPSAHHRSGFWRAFAACVALSGTTQTLIGSIPTSRLQLPAPLPSERFCFPPLPTAEAASRYYEGSDSCRSHQTGRSLRLLRFAVAAFRPQPRKLPTGRFISRLSADGCFQASPRMSRLATALRRIRFVILRTAGSPPVAPHPASRRRSYLRLRSQRLAPARTYTTLSKRPHGRTRSRESGNPRISRAYPGPRFRRGRRLDKGSTHADFAARY
jgi:hypothetical protein